MTESSNYQAYLVRFQRNGDQPRWRATLQNAHTGEKIRFANENDLFDFLIDALGVRHQYFHEESANCSE